MCPSIPDSSPTPQPGLFAALNEYSPRANIDNAREWWLYNEQIGHWFVRRYDGGGYWICDCVCRARRRRMRLDEGHDLPRCKVCGETTGRAEFLRDRAAAKAKNEARALRAKYIRA